MGGVPAGAQERAPGVVDGEMRGKTQEQTGRKTGLTVNSNQDSQSRCESGDG